MDEKTEQLRDIFMDVAEDGTVTESQSEQRGSLLREGSVDERLAEVIEEMRGRFDFESGLEVEEYCAVVRQFYDGRSDEEIASTVEVSPETVFVARTDLHLLCEEERRKGAEIRERLSAEADVETVASERGESPESIRRARRIAETQVRTRRHGQRFRTEFEEILTDADIAVRLTATAHEDGLEEATEDMEVDVDF